ncbi:MAG: hypothetical protein N4A35_14940 [Flavobacteriales bacterium]|jgi:hypothetical protein|nr:hypothetical protein [Flavobacteriales bacterium]
MISCLDVVEEIELNESKGGKAIYTINLSQSKIKLNTLMKLDSIDGHRIPKQYEIESELAKAVQELRTKKGITGARYELNKTEYIYTLEVEFLSVNDLDLAIRTLSYWRKSDWKPQEAFYVQKERRFIKHVPQIHVKEKDLGEVEKRKESLKLGSYTFILRNEGEVSTNNHKEIRVSGNKRAALFRKDLYNLAKYRNGFNLEMEVK